MSHRTGESQPALIANIVKVGEMASLLPFLLELEIPRRPHHHHAALALARDEMFDLLSQPQLYYRPWRQSTTMLQDASSIIKADSNNFQINLDVRHFAPEEITVKTCDGFVVVEGKHEEKRDELGWVSRQFRRRYTLPVGCGADALQSRLSSDGVLTVTMPLTTQAPGERLVPVVHTGPVLSGGALDDGESLAFLDALIENGQ